MLLRSLLVLLACLSLAFAVTPAQAQQVQLTWDVPLQTNGTPVPNLAGYKLYYGSQSGQYPTMVPVGLTTAYTVTNLSVGQTYYFATKAYNSTGTESAFSNEVRVTLPTNTVGGGLIPRQQMRIVSVDSQELVGENGAATNVLDGNTTTFWHTEWSRRTPTLPHSLVLDLGARYQVDGFRYLPRQDGSPNGTIAGYQFYVSDDGVTWGTPAAAGTLAANTREKTVRFTAKTGRFVRLVALSEINGRPWTSAAELNIFGAAAPSSTTTTSGLLAQSVTMSPVTSSKSTSTTTVSKSTTTTSPMSTSQSTTQTASATVSSVTSSSSTPTMTASQNTTFGQIQGLQHVDRWFTYNGQYIFLIGYDAQELAADPSLDYNAALDFFVQYRLNKVRIWIGYCYWNSTFLAPWVVSNGKFDLDTWNPVFWQRVARFVAAAQRRNIMVEATVIAPNNIDSTNEWPYAAWNNANNVNGVSTANSREIFSPEFWDLNHAEVSTSGKLLVDYQEALVDKTVLELGAFPNVYLEIANEFPARNANVDLVYPWQLVMAQRINASTTSLVTAHAHEFGGDQIKGVQYYWNEPYIDVLGFHFSASDPGTISSLLHPVQTHGKVIQQNEGKDPYLNLSAATRSAWGWVLSGGHYAMYEDDSSRIGTAGWISGAQRLKVLHDIVDTVNWWQMSPVDTAGNEYDSLITQGPSGSNHQVFANPGVHYLAYFWGTQSTNSVSIRVPAGSYDYYWYDPRAGSLLEFGSASPSGTGSMSISSPRTSSWDSATGLALVIKHR